MPPPAMQPTWDREDLFVRSGARFVAGVDEVGRGPLAGPVVAAAVVLRAGRIPRNIRDSKTIGREEREEIAGAIRHMAHAVAIASASAAEVDRLNIRQATLLAMRRAVFALPLAPDHVLVDGNDLPDFGCDATSIVKGDCFVVSIAAASIVAKVARDGMMRRLESVYPGYGFDRHAGYATAFHRAALARLGPCPAHRKSFTLAAI